MSLPKDPVMLLSVVNTKLRDLYPNLEELAAAESTTVEEVVEKLKTINYLYDETRNQFTQLDWLWCSFRKETNYAN